MYKIAICDDEKSSAAQAAELLDRYKKAHPGLEFAADIFYTSFDLLDAAEKHPYDIYLLDIYIDRLNGIELAKSIRQIDANCNIIYMTSSNAFYKEAFRIHAVHYLEKPILEDDFFDAMDRVCQAKELRYLTVRESGNIGKIPVDDILYVESEDHYKRIVTTSGNILVRSTISALFSDIDSEHFYMLGMNRIINLAKVLKINKEILTMEDGKQFNVPRGTYRALGELVLQYSFPD